MYKIAERKGGMAMKAETRIFGTIDIEDDKVITMEKGMIGFPDYKHFALIFDKEREEGARTIMWLQCMDDGDIAFPVITPGLVQEDYKPTVSDEIISPLGELTEDNVYMLVTVTVPKDITKLTCNLQAPIVINSDNNKAVQVIVDNNYPIKLPIYDLLRNRKAGE